MRIQKFNKDHFRSVEYTFLNAFPVNVTSMPVSYAGNRVLECQVTFAYDRYFFGKLSSLKDTSKDLQDNGGAVEITTPNTVGNKVFADNEWGKTGVINGVSDGTLTPDQGEYLTGEENLEYLAPGASDLTTNQNIG